MSDEYIHVIWKGKTETYSNNDWLSPKGEAFIRFCRDHQEEEPILKHVGDYVRDLIESHNEYKLIHAIFRSEEEEIRQMSIEDAEKKFNEYLKNIQNTHRSSLHLYDINAMPSTYDSEYENPTEEDLVIAAVNSKLGWHIWGNPWNDNLIDEQRMELAMHMEHNGSLKYCWYMIFKYPDFLDDHIDMDKIFDDAALEIAQDFYNYEDEDFA